MLDAGRSRMAEAAWTLAETLTWERHVDAMQATCAEVFQEEQPAPRMSASWSGCGRYFLRRRNLWPFTRASIARRSKDAGATLAMFSDAIR